MPRKDWLESLQAQYRQKAVYWSSEYALPGLNRSIVLL